jgi:hypothetical protein
MARKKKIGRKEQRKAALAEAQAEYKRRMEAGEIELREGRGGIQIPVYTKPEPIVVEHVEEEVKKRPRKAPNTNKPPDLGMFSREEEDQVLALAADRLGVRAFFDTLEDLVCDEKGFGLTTATPLQRAVLRVAEGRPLGELANDATVIWAFNGEDAVRTYEENPYPHPEIIFVAAVRCGKSLFAAALAIWASQTCDVSKLKEGEIPRYSILSLTLDNAKVTLGHLVGALQKEYLRHLKIDKPEDAGIWQPLLEEAVHGSVGVVVVKHPSGRPIEIRIVAGQRAGGSLISRWSIGGSVDEATRMVGAREGVINYDDAFRAIRTRLLPGAQLFSIGSPWQPYGPIYDRVQKGWGTPTESTIVLKGRGPDLNPFWWTEERCEEIKESDPVLYHTDVLAEFADPEESLFTQMVLAECTRMGEDAQELPYDPTHDYAAAIDPATRGNAWTLVIVDRKDNQKRVVFIHEWQGTTVTPLRPRVVLEEMREIMDMYQLDWCYTDQWAADAIRDLAQIMGLYLVEQAWTQKFAADSYLSLATAMAEGQISLPNNAALLKDLRLVKKVVKQRGYAIHLPSTPDGRHCDYAPALTLALHRWLDDEKELAPQEGEEGYNEWLEEEMERIDVENYLIEKEQQEENNAILGADPGEELMPW